MGRDGAVPRTAKRALWLGLGALGGCSDYKLYNDGGYGVPASPIIEVDPDQIDFLPARADAVQSASFVVRNVGDAPLTVTGLSTPTSSDFTLVGDGAGFLLDAGAEQTFEVQFQPTVAPVQHDAIHVTSDDPDHPDVPVGLSGSGLLPWLIIDPPTWDFGALAVPCPDRVDLRVQNVGAESVTVTGLDLVGDGAFSVVEAPPLPWVLTPYDYAVVTVEVTPASSTSIAADLQVTSDDPRGVVSASLLASPTDLGEKTESFTVPDAPPVDVVVAVDQSASMDDDAASLGANFGTFIDTISAETTGWQLGVVTLDSACFNGGVLDATSAGLKTTFASAVALGDDRDITDDERLLQLASRALDRADDLTADCNAGFLRDEALLHVIVVSDEPERSPEEASAWTWDYWVDRYEALKSAPGLVKVSGVIDLGACGEGAAGYVDAIAATGGEALSICDGDWASYLAALARASTAELWRYPLAEPAIAGSIAVTVDGVPASGWTFDAAANAVVFADRPDGSAVAVTYRVASACE